MRRRQVIDRGQVVNRVDLFGQPPSRGFVQAQLRPGDVPQNDLGALASARKGVPRGRGRGVHGRNDQQAYRRLGLGQKRRSNCPAIKPG